MADYIKLRTHIVTHERFLEAGPVARDLYVWGMLYAGHLETDGSIPMVALLAAPWGSGGKSNIRVAAKLVDLGLWERTDKGFRVLKWSEQGNATKAFLESKREEDRKRKALARAEKAARLAGVSARTPPGVTVGVPPDSLPCSSYSPSGSGSSEGVQGERPPDWFAVGAVATVEMAGLKVDDVGLRWLEYVASRQRKSWPMNHGDAVGWLTSVLRTEARAAREGRGKRGAEITKQPTDPEAPWMKLPEVG